MQQSCCDSLLPVLILIHNYPLFPFLDTPTHPPPVLSSFPAPLLNHRTGYSPDTGHYYPPPASQLFSATALDPRSRLGSTNRTSTGMAHTPRTPALTNTGFSTRDVYAGSRPSYMRTTDHLARSPSFATPLRRHPLSPTPSPNIGFTSPVRMESVHHQYGKGQVGNVPPLMALVGHGQLLYGDATTQGSGTQVKVEIHGHIDKGFFLSDGDWTCYRRNYFSCVCSYSLTPYYPNATLHFIPSGTASTYTVHGFAMCISAVVSDSDSQSVDLVQHTPKRDKGPITKPEKVRLLPKPAQQAQHPMGMYQDHHALAGGARGMYEGYGQSSQSPYSTEHTFERIQFKQATANNGKRRAAQQYYHLVVELFADVGSQGGEQFIKVAERKSAKMIVRGRSPGHYQSERRGSTSSGPGGSSGMPGGYSSSQVMGADFGTGSSSLLPNAYSGTYEVRSGHYGATRHPDLGLEPMIPSAEEAKAIDTTKDYQYYPATIYEGVETRQGIDMYPHRNDPDTLMTGTNPAGEPGHSKVKHEYETLPRIHYQAGSAYHPRSCSRFGGRPSSDGFYPTPPLPVGVDMTPGTL
ncbi:p53-like transcription factor [Poronia punctata]|nr:p53-like transcription factor [Poronia punctata]